MKILLDLGDLDTNADDDEVLSIIRSVVMDSHELESGELLHIASVSAEVVESASSTKPARSFLAWIKQQAKRDDPVGDLARDVKVMATPRTGASRRRDGSATSARQTRAAAQLRRSVRLGMNLPPGVRN